MIEENEAAVLRYSLSGQSLHRWLEIPAWMFDPTVGMSWRITTAPHVELGALASLRDTDNPSQTQAMGTASGSHDTNQGDVHAAQADDIPAQSVFQAERRQDDTDTAMAGAAWPAAGFSVTRLS
jgi:hypothetical protein